jgi:shikimate dehydrogenase
VTAATPVYGVLGRPVAHSLSPALHNAAFVASGLDAIYVPLAGESFADFEGFAAAFDVRGVSVTAPFKRDAYAALAAPDDAARTLGAVNTLRRSSAGWEGCNTDVAGFLAPLAGRVLTGQRVAILGAGGAARAVAWALGTTGAAVAVHARRPERAREVADMTGARVGAWPPAHQDWDVLVNTTPIGTAPHGDEVPLALEGDLSGRLIYDLVYNPPETALLRRARLLGAEGIGGLPMLVAQAAAQFQWWTGLTAPVAAMQEAAQSRLGVGVAVARMR